ncbi:zinc finger homeobox protein 2 isoform X2 [Hippocampus zosterae]|uniref:zinc finger homeobox protein 2 isoform X2 n=1 Tax=Hippocampus zosterae TaxID=109293 RepID=UPI00223E2005|nr:zinc finger homeobox protein 2 isoform X2 [Hippocampus zosterae]
MQEESGEKANRSSHGTAARLCPLCQKGQEDQASLSRHLTEQHSVLPSCVDKLLDISVLKEGAREEENRGAPISSVCTRARPSEDISSQLRRPCSDTPRQHRDREMEEDRMLDPEGSGAEPEPEDEANEIAGAKRAVAEDEDPAEGGRHSSERQGAPAETAPLFKCNACQETFPSRTALSVHYHSPSHFQRMTMTNGGEIDPPSPYAPVVSRPFVSNKPYQCAICRVSYNHSITLESHMKSVLHQTRSRNAANNAGALGNGGAGRAGSPRTAAGTSANGSGAANCAATGTATARDAERVQTSRVARSLMAPPVASAQAVSAFLTLLTSSPSTLSHPLLPTLFAPGHPTGVDASQIVPQHHMVMPLILNGLQARQSQQSADNQQGQLLTQCVPFVGLNAAQQALLTQRISLLQNQWAPVALPTPTPAVGAGVKQESVEKPLDGIEARDGIKTEETEEECCPDGESKGRAESAEDAGKTSAHQTHAETEESANPPLSPLAVEKRPPHNPSAFPSIPSDSPPRLNLALGPDPAPQKSQRASSPRGSPATPKASPLSDALSDSYGLRSDSVASVCSELPVLSEFQSEVLWAFFESRSEADAASPAREDCEALGREVGLSEEEVRAWLGRARRAKRRQRDAELTRPRGSSEVARNAQSSDNDLDDEERSLIIAEEEEEEEEREREEADTTAGQAMDLSRTRGRRRPRSVGREARGDSCLTSDSENEVYTSVIVTDEESQNGGSREAPDSAAKDQVQNEVDGDHKGSSGGKVLRSTTVFLSDAEDEYDDEDGGGAPGAGKKKRRAEFEHEPEVKRERLDPDVDLELEAQGDPPNSLPYSLEQIPCGALRSLPLSLAPFSAQFLNPYVLSLAPSLVGGGSKGPCFSNPSSTAPFPATLLPQSPSPRSHSSSRYLSNGGDCETALDLSMGKNASSSSPLDGVSSTPKGRLLDGLGLRPASEGLVVVQVKPESLAAAPSSYGRVTPVNSNHLTKPRMYAKPEEQKNVAPCHRDHVGDHDKEQEQQQRKAKGKRYRDMRRSRTIIQAEQLDILYGCYFKDPNPGKHEFEQISEWVHLPKKVVQIWFQNMRARERKGEVRFISDGTLAAVGKPLIKFTWPLSKPIFSNKAAENNAGFIAAAPIVRTLIKTEAKPAAVKKSTPVPIKPKEVASAVSKTRLESAAGKVASGAAPTPLTTPKEPLPIASRLNRQKKCEAAEAATAEEEEEEEEESEEEKTDEELDDENLEAPRIVNRMVPKLPVATPMESGPPPAAILPQKPNGLSYWNPKASIRINTLSREQLALPAHVPPRTIPPPPTPSIAPVSPNAPNSAKAARSSTPVLGKSSAAENNFLAHSSSRRPRTHLSCLQLSILQSCYETCAHPNALECEAIGAELNLPLKVVQIWFQNTRAKEKRWRLQQEKLGPQAGGKASMSSGSYLQYNALKANRPILPKPVQLTITESPGSPVSGQSAPGETLTGCCDVCKVSFESRAAARAHVFSSLHLAKLRTTNFGQPAALVNKNGTGNGASGGVNLSLQVCRSSAVAGSGGVVVIELPPPPATSNS